MKVIEINQKPFKCSQCDVRFTSARNIPRHMHRVHSQKELMHLQCYHCKKVFATKGNHDAHFEKKHLEVHLLYVPPEEVKGN